MFMLVIGGAFGIVMRTGTLITVSWRLFAIPAGMKFSLFCAVYSVFTWRRGIWYGRRGLAFAIIIAPLMVRLGYDSITPSW